MKFKDSSYNLYKYALPGIYDCTQVSIQVASVSSCSMRLPLFACTLNIELY